MALENTNTEELKVCGGKRVWGERSVGVKKYGVKVERGKGTDVWARSMTARCRHRLRKTKEQQIEFEKWANLMENGTDKNFRTVIFDNAKELVARRMKELCDKCGIWIILSVPYSPSSNSVTTNGTWAMSHGSRLPPRFRAEAMGTFMYLQNHTNGDEHSI